MKLIDTVIADVKMIEPEVHLDARGFLVESFRSCWLPEFTFVQDNHSRSSKNTLRGLHYQLTKSQGKLVRVTSGSVFDVAVDMRKSSITFGRWVGKNLTEENKLMMWIPPGFAHGFVVLSNIAEFQYKCTNYYESSEERCVAWNDPDLSINWPVDEPVLSDRDKMGTSFASAECYD